MTYYVIGLLMAFHSVLDDINVKMRRGRSVVIFPLLTDDTFSTTAIAKELPQPWAKVREYIAILEDTPVIVPAGNVADRSRFTDTLPALFVDRWPNTILVAGAVTDKGEAAYFSQRVQNTYWAPGQHVECAGSEGNENVTRSGTSFAAAMVGGLVAYFLGLPTVPFPTKQELVFNAELFLTHKASRRISSGRGSVSLIWNLQDIYADASNNLTDTTRNRSLPSQEAAFDVF